MIVYLDTSALLKLYLAEPESREVEKQVAAATGCFTHLISWPELCAALARAVRVERMDEAQRRQQLVHAEHDWRGWQLLQVDEAIIRRAGELATTFELQGYDSVHLAAAERMGRHVGETPFRFAAFDHALCAAASSLGLALL